VADNGPQLALAAQAKALLDKRELESVEELEEDLAQGEAADKALTEAEQSLERAAAERDGLQVKIGLGRMIASYDCSSTL
jgi:hypothetical protein